MLKITDYFYTFSKFTTSLVLLGFLIIMGYALYLAYEDVDEVSIDLENKFSNLTENININSIKFLKIEEMIKQNATSLNKINDNILNSNFTITTDELQKKNNELLNEIKIIKDQIKNLTTNNKAIINNASYNGDDFNLAQIKFLKEFILLKYEDGEMVNSEINLLESLALETSNEVFEKIYLIESENFFGKEYLIKQFDLSVQEYVKKQFLENNQNSVIKFILSYVNVKPNNLNIYDSEDLNILSRAKNHLNDEEYIQSFNQVLLLKEADKYFNKWLKQIRLYIDFKTNILKVN